MFDTIKRIREKNAQLFCGSAIILALSISGCTTSGTSLLENVASDAALADNKNGTAAQDNTPATAQAAADQKAGAATIAAAEIKAAPQTATAEPEKQADKKAEKTALLASADTAIAATNQVIQDAESAPAEQPSTLAALFGTRSKPTAALAAVSAEAEPVKPAETAAKAPAAAEPAQDEVAVTGKPQAAPPTDRTSQSAGAAARLFSPGKNSVRGTGKLEATITASAATKNTSDYNYTLPGVRANGGVEIRHRNKVFDENDIDLDEDDYSAPVTMASAGGMARLAPNGLRTQHDKVQVSCLKPQLVSMIKRLESHYRKPVVITSGYRSPAHNRSVKGAKRSLHMSCSAADLQIPGVSKWEIARHVRSWPSRGGVGTYCHTESVHIDVGPERDWNWRCRRG